MKAPLFYTLHQCDSVKIENTTMPYMTSLHSCLNRIVGDGYTDDFKPTVKGLQSTSVERSLSKRGNKIYIDYLQNRPIQTICAPYSLRPKPGATASAPLHWDEVKKGLKVSNFTIKNMLERVKSEGDLFDGVLGKGIDLNGVLKGLAQLI